MQMKVQDKRQHKVKCDYGIIDYYKSYKKTVKNPVNKQTYSNVLKDFLNFMKQSISQEGYSFKLPQRLGKIEIRKSKRNVKILPDGSIKNTLSINWKETLKLWENNLEAKIKKTKIRYTNEHTDGYVFTIVYLKHQANYKNKSIYSMQINREMRRSTENPIINHKIDAFLLK